ncbi:cuticle protein 6-like [Argiope bruennichi]|uniref:Cuticle protein 6 like protein n=1 Tax=Argiope bruennichi TaxID=94029 RepID=A0A8T0EW23_ARGBR|nr:cuticle protein 6-like [Argiope bruennichi]KAF8778229.1 Cuticle protein 6 like protein [Argiope bruennichi]
MLLFTILIICLQCFSWILAGPVTRRSTTAGIYGRVVPIPAGTRAHYNIQNFAGPGTYKFGYDTGPGPNQSFRQEERGPGGEVKGRYGYVEPSGALRVVEYMADSTGFHILKTRTLVPDMKPKPAVKVRTPFVGPLPPFIPTSYVVNLAG